MKNILLIYALCITTAVCAGDTRSESEQIAAGIATLRQKCVAKFGEEAVQRLEQSPERTPIPSPSHATPAESIITGSLPENSRNLEVLKQEFYAASAKTDQALRDLQIKYPELNLSLKTMAEIEAALSTQLTSERTRSFNELMTGWKEQHQKTTTVIEDWKNQLHHILPTPYAQLTVDVTPNPAATISDIVSEGGRFSPCEARPEPATATAQQPTGTPHQNLAPRPLPHHVRANHTSDTPLHHPTTPQAWTHQGPKSWTDWCIIL